MYTVVVLLMTTAEVMDAFCCIVYDYNSGIEGGVLAHGVR